MSVRVFFYGLFMDRVLLEKRGLAPTVLGPARLDGSVLRVGQRAALVPEAEGSCFGIVMELEDEELAELYAEPSVRDYRPERCRVALLSGEGEGDSIETTGYNLPPESIGSAVDRAYVQSLAELAAELQLPASYVREIESLAE